jgi:PIN domain nuclease of toxin-antitoxin system
VADLLLDTCAMVWTALGEPISEAARSAIEAQPLHVSAITALEIAMLAQRNRLVTEAPTKLWFAALMRRLSARLVGLDPDSLIESAELPGDPPRDPFDRIVIAAAVRHRLRLVTRDRLILAYCQHHGIPYLHC